MSIEEINKIAPILFLIQLLILLMNGLMFLGYFLNEKLRVKSSEAVSQLTKQMLFYWWVQVIGMGVAAFCQGSNLLMLIPFSFNMVTIHFIYKGIFSNYSKVSSYKKFYYIFFGVGWPLAFELEMLFSNFTYTAMPLAIAQSLPLLEMFRLSYFDKKNRFNTHHHKWFGVVIFFGAIHVYNFALFRNDPHNLIWGTTVHIMILLSFGVIITNFHNYMIHKSEKERLKDQVEQKTKEIQDRLAQVQELKEKNEDLFKVVLHDISNPMSAVIGYLTLLEGMGVRLSEEQKVSYVTKATASAKSVADTIRQVRALAAAENADDILKEAISTHEALETLKIIYEPLYDKKGVKLLIQNQLGNCMFKGNRELFIHSAIGNLLSNSLKFSEKGSAVELICMGEGEYIHFQVKDQGMGIHEKNIPGLFDLKYSGSTPGTEGEVGTGFGLPLMKKYIDQNEGEFAFETKTQEQDAQNHGTIFNIKFKKI